MAHHEYQEMWMPFAVEKLETAMEPNNVKEKYAVRIFQEGKKKVIGHFPLGTSTTFYKAMFTL